MPVLNQKYKAQRSDVYLHILAFLRVAVAAGLNWKIGIKIAYGEG